MKFTSHWTGKSTDWLHPSLFFFSLFFALYYPRNRRKASEAWYSTRVGPHEGLPEWQQAELSEHWGKRASSKARWPQIIWTRSSEGAAVTELEHHWAQVKGEKNSKFGFIAYSKDTGGIAYSWSGYETEQKAMHAAVDFMRDGKDPRKIWGS